MTRALNVFLDGLLAGVVTMSAGGALAFTYEDGYLAQRYPTPLSLSMPTGRKAHKNRAVLPFLQGLLPDNAQALASMATAFGVSATSPFALLEHVGADVAGALQFMPIGVPAPDAAGFRTKMRPLSDAGVEELLRDAVEEYRVGKPTGRHEGRFSLSGAQPKIALCQTEEGSWAMPEESTPTTHILKPATESFRRIDIVEQLTMRAARNLGLNVAESQLVSFGDTRTFITTRYDRVRQAGVWRRLHQEDLCQALAVLPAKKYQRNDGGPGASAVAGLIESFPRLDDRRQAARSFFTAFVFNAVTAGTDAHAKNYSLMLSGDRITLAPLYDLATYALYRKDDEAIYLPMSVNGEYRSDRISSKDLVAVGTKLRLAPEDAAEIVSEIRAGAVSAFEAAHEEFACDDRGAEQIAAELASAVARLPLTQ